MKIKQIIAIAKKDFFNNFTSLGGYIPLAIFILVSYFLFFRVAYANNDGSLRSYVSLLPWLLILYIPAITMRSLSEEQKGGTLEVLMTHPINEWEIILGKFLGSFAYYLVTLAITLILPLTIASFVSFDPGVLVAQYLGMLFLGGFLICIGIFASTLFKNAIGSFLTAAFISFVLVFLSNDFIALAFGGTLGAVVGDLSVVNHVNSVSRGVIDLRDILYFVFGSLIFLSLAYWKLMSSRVAQKRTEQNKLAFGMVLIILIAILIQWITSDILLRLDLTHDQLYTLSPASAHILQTLPDTVTITFFASHNLPTQLSQIVQAVQDELTEFSATSHGKVIIQTKYPDTDPTAQSLAANFGIQPVQFNSIATGNFSIQQGYLAIGIKSGTKIDSIPFIQTTNDLEYQLIRRINKVAGKQNKTVGFLTGDGEKDPFTDMPTLSQDLQSEYSVVDVTISDGKLSQVPTSLVVVGPVNATNSAVVQHYLQNGGRVAFFGNPVSITTQPVPSATQTVTGYEDFLKHYGVTLHPDLVYDTQLNTNVSLSGNGGFNLLVPYPLWIRALPSDRQFAPTSGLQTVLLPWPSSLTLSSVPGWQVHPILQTSRGAGDQTGSFTIDPTQGTFTNLQKTLYVGAQAVDTKSSAKLIVIADSNFALEQFTKNNPDDLTLAENIIDYITQDTGLIAIRSKQRVTSVFHFSDPNQQVLVEYIDMFGVPLVIIIGAFIYLANRKRKQQRTYQPSA